MSASSDYLRVLTDITREGGATRAATARANAAIWGNSVAKLGDFASDAIKQYSVDKKAKKDEQWQQDLSDLFRRSSEEFKAQQQPSMAELTAGAPTTTETYTPGGLQGSFAGNIPQSHVTTETTAAPQTFTGPELKTARPPRSSPFPTPSEILALGQPLNGIKVIDGLAALQKLNPQDDEATRVKRMQAVYLGLDQFSDEQKAAAFPGLMGAFEQVYGTALGDKTFTPEKWKAIGAALQIPKGATEDLVPIPGPNGPVYGRKVAGQSVYEKPSATSDRLVPVPGPDGKPVYGAPVAGQPVYEKPGSNGSPNVGSFEDYVLRRFGDTPTDAQILQARKDYDQSDDRPRITVNTAGGGGTLTPEAVEDTATRYRILGTAAIPTRIEASERVRIMNEAAKQQRALGQTAAQAVQKQAAFKSDAASLTQMTKMASSAEAFETKALAQTDLISDLSKKVPRSASPLLNAWWLSGKKTVVGDKNTSLLFNALDTFTSEYAKIMSGSTGSVGATSDAATRKAEGLVSAAMNKGTLQATLDQMKWEMDQTRKGYDATIAHITDRMGGTTPSAAPIVNPTGRFNPATGKVEPIH